MCIMGFDCYAWKEGRLKSLNIYIFIYKYEEILKLVFNKMEFLCCPEALGTDNK